MLDGDMADSLQRFVSDAFQDLEAEEGPTLPMVPGTLPVQQAGQKMGRYTLLSSLGQGGFGEVWLAEQAVPVRRQVALKVIKAGMDTREVIARFEAERQALAVMDHPNIAKVFDAGATPTGRPFFVMELVRGESVTRWCDRQCAPLEQRLALFIDVCRAVHHAHQKGIIHRDLKPSNLLVCEQEGAAVPKVIDFGIAKATSEERLTELTLVTRLDRLMGTPAYMSPEQATPGMDLDTRTDIYSLGVVLYELLTGQVPYQPSADGRVQHEKDAQKPSTRIKALTAELQQRLGMALAAEPPKLVGRVRGDLDWITMKALAVDRTRRYDSAQALAEDVRRFLNQEPVSARPPTTWYLLRRFTQRNKLAVGAAAMIVLLLVVGVATSTILYLRAKTALAKSEQVSAFLKRVLEQAGPSKALGRDTTMLREILDETATNIGTQLAGQPEVAAELHGILAHTYEAIDEYDLAHAEAERQLQLVRARHSGDDPVLADALMNRGSSLESLGRSKEALVDLRQALEIRQRLYGEEDIRTGELHNMVAFSLVKSGRAAEGESSARTAMALWRKHWQEPLLAGAPNTLSAVLFNTKRVGEAVEVMKENLAVLRRLHPKPHPDVVNCLDNLGHDLVLGQRFEEAEPYLLESLEMGKVIYQDRNPVADHAYASLSRVASSRQQWDKQLEYARASAAAARAVFKPGHRYYREGTTVLARALIDHAERCADEAWKTKDAAVAKKALGYLDELSTDKDFASDVKSAGGWLDCLRGRVWMLAPATHAEGKALLARGIEALSKKDKPTADDERRLKKAKTMLL